MCYEYLRELYLVFDLGIIYLIMSYEGIFTLVLSYLNIVPILMIVVFFNILEICAERLPFQPNNK